MSELNFGEYVYDYDQEKWHDLPDGSYVAVKDVPAIVAADLERLAEDWEAEAEQIKSSPCFNDYDESTVDEIAVRVTALRKRATELLGEQ